MGCAGAAARSPPTGNVAQKLGDLGVQLETTEASIRPIVVWACHRLRAAHAASARGWASARSMTHITNLNKCIWSTSSLQLQITNRQIRDTAIDPTDPTRQSGTDRREIASPMTHDLLTRSMSRVTLTPWSWGSSLASTWESSQESTRQRAARRTWRACPTRPDARGRCGERRRWPSGRAFRAGGRVRRPAHSTGEDRLPAEGQREAGCL